MKTFPLIINLYLWYVNFFQNQNFGFIDSPYLIFVAYLISFVFIFISPSSYTFCLFLSLTT